VGRSGAALYGAVFRETVFRCSQRGPELASRPHASGHVLSPDRRVPAVGPFYVAAFGQLPPQADRRPGDLQVRQCVLEQPARAARAYTGQQKRPSAARPAEIFLDPGRVGCGKVEDLHPRAPPLVLLLVLCFRLPTLPVGLEAVDMPIDDHCRMPPRPEAKRLEDRRVEPALVKRDHLHGRRGGPPLVRDLSPTSPRGAWTSRP